MDGSYQGAPLWERQEGEGREAFAAFKVYRDLPPRDRSIDAAFFRASGDQSGRKKGAKRAPTRWFEWSRRYDWVNRACAWDKHLRDKELAAQEEAIAKDAELWAERQRQQREDEWTARTRLLEKINQMLQLPVVDQVITDPQGRTITVKAARWHFGTVAQLLDLVAKLGRLSTEMDTAQQKADVRVERDLQNALVKLERELPSEVFAQVLKTLAGGDGPTDAQGAP